MLALLIYFLAVLLLAGLGFLAIVNFWRYHLQGDKTGVVVTLFVIIFFLIILSTILLIHPDGLTGDAIPTGDFEDVF